MAIVPTYGQAVKLTDEIQSLCRELLDEQTITDIIKKLKANKRLKEEQRLWIMYKVAQVQAGRNIIAIAENGLRIMGVNE